jgi:hypothetical protein
MIPLRLEESASNLSQKFEKKFSRGPGGGSMDAAKIGGKKPVGLAPPISAMERGPIDGSAGKFNFIFHFRKNQGSYHP